PQAAAGLGQLDLIGVFIGHGLGGVAAGDGVPESAGGHGETPCERTKDSAAPHQWKLPMQADCLYKNAWIGMPTGSTGTSFAPFSPRSRPARFLVLQGAWG